MNDAWRPQPLEGVRVLDFTFLLPGPLATLILAEAGAEVIKVERPGAGDEMRGYQPRFGASSVNFALLNRGKRSVQIDLKDEGAAARLEPLIREADVLLEQFRPGVMARLGLGYDAVHELNPRLVYCSVTGYGQSGEKSALPGHDLNYAAETGLLSLVADASGAPQLPPALIADIGGGGYPAVMNILLALRRRDRDGEGMHLDVAMAENLFPFLYWAIGNGEAAGEWPRPGNELVTGGSPRYGLYPTADGNHVAVAALEDRFWDNLCDLLGLSGEERDDRRDPEAARAKVAERIADHDDGHWRARFAETDVCCSVVVGVRDAMADPHFVGRGVFDHLLRDGMQAIHALPVPLVPGFRAPERELGYPALGEANDLLDHDR